MRRTRERIIPQCGNRNPLRIPRSIENNLTRLINARKDIHDYLEMCVSVLHAGEGAHIANREVNTLANMPNASRLRGLSRRDPTPGKRPEPTEQPG